MKTNEEKYISKNIFVEIIYLNSDKSFTEGMQCHGIIKKISSEEIVLERVDTLEDFVIPFEEDRIMDAMSVEAKELKKNNNTIGDVDFIYFWKITLPRETEIHQGGLCSIAQQHKGLSRDESENRFTGKTGKLKVQDRVWLSGGYDLAEWLNGSDGYWGTVDYFIPGQNKLSAVVVKLDNEIPFKNYKGGYLVLELRWEGAEWGEQGVVHVELCNFIPEKKTWKERKQGMWVESHAVYTKVS